MTNFADRLVARGAGQPTGFPLLKARPAARFEQEMSPQIEAEPPAGQRSETPTQPSAPLRKTSPTPVKAKETRQVRTDEPASPVDGVTRGVSHPPPASGPLSTPVRSLPRTAKISPRESEKLGQSETPGAEPPTSRPLSIEHPEVPHDQRPMFFDLPPIAPMATVLPPVESAPPPPSISIGRIDVQFLPPERPAAPARPEPRRTRGFETYTRARRGEPR